MRRTDNRDFHPVPIPGGEHCPKCRNLMQRYTHNHLWIPLPGHGYYKHWDKCTKCRRHFNPPDAYVKGWKK